MSANKLCGRVYHHISAMLDRTNKERRAKGVIYNKGYVVTVSHFGHCLKIGHVGVRITKSFGIHHLGIGLDSSLERFKVVYINNGVGNTLC